MAGGGGGSDSPGLPAAFGRIPTRYESIQKELKLTDAQKPQVEAVFDAAQKQYAAAAQPIAAIRTTILNASVKGENTAETVAKLAEAHTPLVRIEADTLTKLLAVLDEKQKAKAPKLFDLMFTILQNMDWRTAR